MTNVINRNLFVKSGARGGKQKGINFKAKRKELITEISKYVAKEDLNWIQARLNNDQLERLLKAWKN